MQVQLFLNLCLLPLLAVAAASEVTEQFRNPVITRLYESNQYALADSNRADGIRVNVTRVASALAGLKPSYVNSLIYLGYNVSLTQPMIADFKTIRSTVRASSPECKFDVELSLNPQTKGQKPTYPNAEALVTYMKGIHAQIPVDGWWFDFYDEALHAKPDWVHKATAYAHSNNQTVGGNVFGSVVPPGADAVAFVDNTTASSPFGFDFKPNEITALKHNTTTAAILGHLQSNAQNGPTTESNVYSNEWNSTRRADYLHYWVSQQAPRGFKFMLPLFYPEYPGAYAFNPLDDKLHNGTLYDYIKQLAENQ